MCNAFKHPPGCECGFGRPYLDSISYGDATEWAVAVIDEPWLLRRSLNDLNWDEEAVKRFIKEYNRLIGEGLPPTTLASRIKELLGWREMVVEERWQETLNVPLYRFGAPSVLGAMVTYNEGINITRQVGWSLKVFGVGTGHTREMSVINQRIFEVSNGACKQVFVPVPMRVERIALYDGGRRVGEGVRAEVKPPSDETEVALTRRGCETLKTKDCGRLGADKTQDLVDCRLSADASGTVYTTEKEWSSDLSSDLSLHLKRIVEIGPVVRVRRLRTLTLKFSLPSGRDYLGHLCLGRLWWEKP